MALGDVQVRACRRKATRGVDTQGRRGRDTGSYPDRGERREVRAWAPRSVKRFPFQGTKSFKEVLMDSSGAQSHPDLNILQSAALGFMPWMPAPPRRSRRAEGSVALAPPPEAVAELLLSLTTIDSADEFEAISIAASDLISNGRVAKFLIDRRDATQPVVRFRC